MQQTQRQFKDVQSGGIYTMWKDPITDSVVLISDNTGEVLVKFYATQIEQTIKTAEAGQIRLNPGEFTRLTVTHYKYDRINPKARFKKLGY